MDEQERAKLDWLRRHLGAAQEEILVRYFECGCEAILWKHVGELAGCRVNLCDEHKQTREKTA